MKCNAVLTQKSTDRRITLTCIRFIIMIGIHRLNVVFLRELLKRSHWCTVQHIQAAAHLYQLLLHTRQRIMYKVHPLVFLVFQTVQYVGVEDEDGQHRHSGFQRMV